MKDSPVVVLVILTCNQKDITLECLKSLFKSDYNNKQILLVDNGSQDQTCEEVSKRFPQVVCLRNEKNLGAAGGRNVGIEYAKEHCSFEYIMFMDNDIIVEPDFLGKLVEGLIDNCDRGIEIATPKLYILGSDRIIDCAGGAKVNYYLGSTQTRGHGEKDVGQYDLDPHPSCVPTTVILHKNALNRAERFDVAFDPYGYEDLDFVLRANRPGTPYLFVPEAVVHHKGSKTGFTGYDADYTKVKASNLKRFLKRHSSAHQKVVFYSILPFLAIKTIVREIKKGNVRSILGLAAGFLKSGK